MKVLGKLLFYGFFIFKDDDIINYVFEYCV